MKIICIGAGPAGLYFSILMKLKNPDNQINIYERNAKGNTFGWGIVFSDQTMENLEANDPKSAAEILDNFAHWDDIDIHHRGEVLTSSGHGFCGIGRQHLLDILEARALELGVNIHYEQEIEIADLTTRFSNADLIIASDGINSKIRNEYEDHFEVDIDWRTNKYVWLGTNKVFEAFTFIFEKTEHGWIWVHAYRFDKNSSTFIVECRPETWEGLGFDKMDQDETCRFCEKLFAKYLDGNELKSNAKHLRGSAWLSFPRVMCDTWHYNNIILLGDAAHTAHFSIGSGTKLGFEDAIKLAEVLNREEMAHGISIGSKSMEDALNEYKEERHLDVLKIQSAARNSTEWFEGVERYLDFEPFQLAYSLLTRSQRVSHENLRERDKNWLEGMEKWLADGANLSTKSGGDEHLPSPTPPMFTPFKLRDLTLQNRVVVSPMCMYSAIEGVPNDFHMVHYGSRAQGGAGLIYVEMTDITAEGRITPGCTGIYNDDQMMAWRRITDYVHATSSAKVAIQLGHAGRKGSTKILWEGYDQPLDQDNWSIMAPSPKAWDDANQVPKEMTRGMMDRTKLDYIAAAKRAVEAGFDLIELHCAHGYLLSSFITPISNTRDDDYGGSLENRLRYPIEIFKAIRAVVPKGIPMAVRISANDWVGDEGVTPDEAVEIARAFKKAGVDIIDVSAGQTSTEAKPLYGRMFQTPFADRIRNEAGIATMAVGNIYEVDHVNSIIAAGRADLTCLARPHLMDPYWTLRAAATQHYRGSGITIPVQYDSGFDQLTRNLERAAMDQMTLKA